MSSLTTGRSINRNVLSSYMPCRYLSYSENPSWSSLFATLTANAWVGGGSGG